ncbi:nucleotide exchange factor sil1 [Dipsacomyces acuminosporus]|nr:nucleotide exchange factor sil1 [Dipsacomyces acuminosporus]
MVRIHTLSLVVAIGLCAAFAVGQQHSSASYQHVGEDTICTVNKNGSQECYPRVFVPKQEFQVVRPGQDIPPGLHVQIDMETGERKARLMDKGAAQQQEEGLVVLPNAESGDLDGKHRQFVMGSAVNKHEGATTSHGNDAVQGYIDRIVELSNKPFVDTQDDSVAKSLVELEELVHDTRHADQLARDHSAIPALLRLSDPSPAHGIHPWPARTRQLSSVVLGTTVQNNQRLQGAAYRMGSIPSLLHALDNEMDLKAAGKHVFALSSLVRGHPGALDQFTQRGGMRILHNLNALKNSYSGGEHERSKLEIRVVRFVEDLFNPDFNPEQTQDSKNLFAQNAPVWCKVLANKLADDLGAVDNNARDVGDMYERRQALAHALLSIRSQYKDACVLPSAWHSWLGHELARVAKEKAEDVEEYRQALIDLSN